MEKMALKSLIGEKLFEMRIHYGPGYRVYYKDTGQEIIILLCGGDSQSQADSGFIPGRR
jgi:putative addiction module killer protein